MSGGVSWWNGFSGGGGSGGGAQAANVVNISPSVSFISITYSSALAAASVPVFAFINTADASPIFLQGMITAYSTTGFTVTFNTATDTANYKISYINMAAV